MIKFNNPSQEIPYINFHARYTEALEQGQKNIESIAISSFNKEKMETDSRFVNLKFIDGNQFIFFSNYNSPKSIAFKTHNQISALLYWSSTNVQIRMKAKINKTSVKYSQEYFKERPVDKNALAISSDQSKPASSYEEVILKYKKTKETKDLLKCPEYWGGFSFTPYYFEFWEGHESRLNKRESFSKIDDVWLHSFLQP